MFRIASLTAIGKQLGRTPYYDARDDCFLGDPKRIEEIAATFPEFHKRIELKVVRKGKLKSLTSNLLGTRAKFREVRRSDAFLVGLQGPSEASALRIVHFHDCSALFKPLPV